MSLITSYTASYARTLQQLALCLFVFVSSATCLLATQKFPVVLGDGTLFFDSAPLFDEYPGRVLDVDYRLKVVSGNKSFYLVDFVFPGSLEEAGASFYRNFLSARCVLKELRFLHGVPRKLVLELRGGEQEYNAYFLPLNSRHAYLVVIVPLGFIGETADSAKSADEVVNSYRLD